MPTRVGEPQHIGGSDRLPTWFISLSEDPSAEWRQRFLRCAHASGIFSGARLTIVSSALVFEMERSALRLACEQIDGWIAQANSEPSSFEAQACADSPVLRVSTILVVDDQPDIGPMARDILEPAGYVVLLTSDPLEAVRMARHRPGDIDLLLVDVVMPLMDGRELARRMLLLRPQMKVMLMSGYELSGLVETGWPFIAKPFGIQELTQKIADTLREDRPPPSPPQCRR
jgi:CheY-like chemotaxis protein